ncbi:hypothetical protein HDA40_003431 [Hamadaea flava]|uniref:Uncharacterized protein n=1 Tax=Hamadaea flava TaxID=1742688 RepID=A0ABV8LIY9_9ACTN|nr:hypothetical protein [Hamadaea flava]MCP2324924.1 hypothetical protein [Hamadaea flava]
MSANESRPITGATPELTASITRPADDLTSEVRAADRRRWRIRRHASRQLDALLGREERHGDGDGDGDHYRETWLDRGVREREARGRDLAASGWLP